MLASTLVGVLAASVIASNPDGDVQVVLVAAAPIQTPKSVTVTAWPASEERASTLSRTVTLHRSRVETRIPLAPGPWFIRVTGDGV